MNMHVNSNVYGIDANYDLTSYAGMIKRGGYTFVGRYLCEDGNDKQLKIGEAQHLSDMGLYIVSCFETNQVSIDYFHNHKPEEDAALIKDNALRLKQPQGTDIYYAVDFDANDVDIVYISNYLKIVKALINPWKLSIYGSGAVCHIMKQSKIANRTWLSMSAGWYGTGEYYWGKKWDINQYMYPPQGSLPALHLQGLDYNTAHYNRTGAWKLDANL